MTMKLYKIVNNYFIDKSLGIQQEIFGANYLTEKREISILGSKNIAQAVAVIYFITAVGCASFNINGVKVYDPDLKQNQKIYANNSENTGTDATIEKNRPWYEKINWYVVGGTVLLIGVAAIIGFAIYNHNKKDADPPPTAPAPAPPPPA